jgi:hypothetical protein
MLALQICSPPKPPRQPPRSFADIQQKPTFIDKPAPQHLNPINFNDPETLPDALAARTVTTDPIDERTLCASVRRSLDGRSESQEGEDGAQDREDAQEDARDAAEVQGPNR